MFLHAFILICWLRFPNDHLYASRCFFRYFRDCIWERMCLSRRLCVPPPSPQWAGGSLWVLTAPRRPAACSAARGRSSTRPSSSITSDSCCREPPGAAERGAPLPSRKRVSDGQGTQTYCGPHNATCTRTHAHSSVFWGPMVKVWHTLVTWFPQKK